MSVAICSPVLTGSGSPLAVQASDFPINVAKVVAVTAAGTSLEGEIHSITISPFDSPDDEIDVVPLEYEVAIGAGGSTSENIVGDLEDDIDTDPDAADFSVYVVGSTLFIVNDDVLALKEHTH